MIRRQPPPILEFANATRRGAYTTLTLNDLGALGLDRVSQPDGGDGAFTHYWAVLTPSVSSAIEGEHRSVLLDGPQKVQSVSGDWTFPLPAGESGVVSFKWGTLFGAMGPAVRPDSSDYPSQFQVSILVFPDDS